MAQTTPNLNLTVWNLHTDPYDSAQLAQNFVALDQHDHSGSGKGTPIDGTTAILNGSITASKLATPSVNTGNIADSAIIASKITDGIITGGAAGTGVKIAPTTITNDNIANATITRSKFASTAKAIPKVAHVSPNGSLPTVTNEGEALYDGYTIDYCFNINKPSTDQSTIKTAIATTYDYVWRLRYSSGSSDWDCVGGTMINLRSTVNAYSSTSASNPLTAGSWFSGWGGKVFQSCTLPLKGTYDVTVTSSMGTTATATGGQEAVAQAAIALGSASTTPISDAAGYSYVNQPDDLTTVTVPFVTINISSTASSANKLQQIFGLQRADYASGTNLGVYRALVYFQGLVIIPCGNFKNFA